VNSGLQEEGRAETRETWGEREVETELEECRVERKGSAGKGT